MLGSLGLFLVLGLTACEAELGAWCSNDTDVVNERVSQDYDSLSQAIVFENCQSSAYCASTDGSRPYCTKRCESAGDCQGNLGEEWECAEIVRFGRHACEDWTLENDCLGSTRPYKYCRPAGPSVIRERDEAYGREWPSDNAPDPGSDAGT